MSYTTQLNTFSSTWRSCD